MNTDDTTPTPQPWIDPALEARIVAHVLGESSAFEAEELKRLVAENPELAIFQRRIEAVHALVETAARPQPPKLQLSPERRKKLLETIGVSVVVPQKKVGVFTLPRPAWWTSQLATSAAACLIMGFLFLALFSSVLFKSPNEIADFEGGDVQPGSPVFLEEMQIAAAVPQSSTIGVKPVDAIPILGDISMKTDIAREPSSEIVAQSMATPAVPFAEMKQNLPVVAEASKIGGTSSTAITANAVPVFEGTIQYGAPISSVEITGSVINQPVFTTRNNASEPTATSFEGHINYGTPILAAAGREFSLHDQKDSKAEGSNQPQALLVRDSDIQKQKTKTDSLNAVLEEGAAFEQSVKNFTIYRRAGDAKVDQLGAVIVSSPTVAGILSESPVRTFQAGASQIQTQMDLGKDVGIERKLNDIILPRVEFQDATVREALDFLKQRAAALDVGEEDPARKGMNIVLKLPPEAEQSQARITLTLTDIPLRGAIDYVAKSANLKLKVEPYAVVVEPISETSASAKAPSARAREVLAAKQPISTFSLHVSDVSFQLAKDALAKGTVPDPDQIRAEEFYNAFDYNDPSPAPGEPVACRIEESAHPFLQQRDLVRVSLKVAASGRAAGQPLRLTILLDTSGSMERDDRVGSVRKALQALATLLGPEDRVTLIGFARTPRLLADQVPGDQAGKLVEIAERTPSEGGTNLEMALALASEQALKQKLPGAQNRIILLTDGAANLGNADPERLARQIEKTRQQGISFDACGVGADGLNDEMLEALTRKGDGRYYFLNKPEDAEAGFAGQLAGALRPAAENVKVQVVFNPARVRQYRLIGFEKHLLKKEDFRNDKVQAAELSAEEAGVALYQVEPIPEGEGDLGQVFVRFRDPANGQMVERSWTMPYDARTPAFDQASPSMQLAATSALLAERLRGDSSVDLNALAPVINNLRRHYPNQLRVQELIRMFEQTRQ